MTKPALFDLWTGGKLEYPHLTLFLNIAQIRMKSEFFGNARTTLDSKKIDAEERLRVAYRLKKYLWKDDVNDKNKSAFVVSEKDIKNALSLLQLLDSLRNFHSHFVHDNAMLELNQEVSKFINELYQRAKQESRAKHGDGALEFYEEWEKKQPIIAKKDGKQFLTREGRLFFLSFFLYSSEMSLVLQQHAGTKRNDSAKFKILQDIFRYYCRRDGEARRNYSQPNSILEHIPKNEQSEIMLARQAYKIIGYLNDLPQELNSPKLFPLYLKQQRIVTGEEYLEFCQANNLFPCFTDITKHILTKQRKDDSTKTMEFHNTFKIDYRNGETQIEIIMHRDQLHQIIVDGINRPESMVFVIQKIEKFVNDRRELRELLISGNVPQDVNRENLLSPSEALEEYYRYKLRGTDELRIKMGMWLDSLSNLKNKNHEQNIINRSKVFLELLNDTPLYLRYNDFYFEKENSKPRASNRFIGFAVNYLIDFNLCKDVVWLCETFNEELRPEKYNTKPNSKVPYCEYKATIEEGWRLKIDNDHVLFKLKNDPNALEYAISHRALKNLMIHLINDKENPFFEKLEAVENELQSIKNHTINNLGDLNVLKEDFLPPYLLKGLQDSSGNRPEELLKKVNNRVQFIISELLPFCSQEVQAKYLGELPENYLTTFMQKQESLTRNPLKKAEKNEQIMRCYQFFEWSYPNDPNKEFKFLRQNEYNNMSILHYCLSKKSSLRTKLLVDSEKGIDIKSRLPKPIEDILFDTGTYVNDELKCTNIDILLRKIAEVCISRIYHWVKDCTPNELKKEKWSARYRVLGINAKPYLDPKSTIHNASLHLLPFSLHPNLVTKLCNSEHKGSVSELFRNAVDTSGNLFNLGLKKELYNIEPYLELLERATPEDMTQVKKKSVRIANNEEVLDMVLWRLAKDYLFTADGYIAKLITETITDGNKVMHVCGLHTLPLKRPIKFEVAIKENDNVVMKEVIIHFNLRFHQLDDYLFTKDEKTLKRAARQLYFRYTEAKDAEKQSKTGITKFEHQGNKEEFESEYDTLLRECRRVYGESLCLIRNLLEWEKNVVNTKLQEEIMAIAESTKKKETEYARIPFLKITTIAGLSDDDGIELDKIRFDAFHAKIPENNSYQTILNHPKFKHIFNLIPRKEKKDFTLK